MGQKPHTKAALGFTAQGLFCERDFHPVSIPFQGFVEKPEEWKQGSASHPILNDEPILQINEKMFGVGNPDKITPWTGKSRAIMEEHLKPRRK